MTEKDFYESQKMFVDWMHNNYEPCHCMNQCIDLKQCIWHEKWKGVNKETEKHEIVLAEIFYNADGFCVYKLVD